MTLYFVGTEDIHFVNFGAPGVTESPGSSGRSQWSRCVLSAFVTSGVDTRWRAPLPGNPVTTNAFWLTFRLYTATAITHPFVRFMSGSAQDRLRIHGHSAAVPYLTRIDNDETVTTLGTGISILPSGGALKKIDIYVNLGTGVVKLYSDHMLILTVSGADLTNSEYSDITGFDLAGNAVYSEVVWRTEDTRSVIGVRSIWPYGDGHAQDWTGTKEDVDEETVDENDANYTDTSGIRQQYTIPPLPSSLTGNVVVGGVMLGARMATNPVDEELNIRTGGNDFESASFDTDGAIEDRMKIWETNPDTSAGWTTDEISDADFNIGVKTA
jgi:hypothetical protein